MKHVRICSDASIDKLLLAFTKFVLNPTKRISVQKGRSAHIDIKLVNGKRKWLLVPESMDS